MTAAKMRAEPVFRNAVAAVTATLMPSMMFMLPMLGAMALPNIPRPGVLFVIAPVGLAHVFRATRLLVMGLLPV